MERRSLHWWSQSPTERPAQSGSRSGCFQPSIPVGNGCRLRIHWTIEAAGIKLVNNAVGGWSHAMSEFARKPAESSHALHTVSGPSAGPAIELAREKHYAFIESYAEQARDQLPRQKTGAIPIRRSSRASAICVFPFGFPHLSTVQDFRTLTASC